MTQNLVSILAMGRVSSSTAIAQKRWVECVQKRIAVTSSVLSNINTVKTLGYAEILSDIILHLREIEVAASARFRMLVLWTIGWCKI